ncbi:hypothetical protein HK096_011168, partial [Nowakowskiella sp. JEL0078]
HESLLNKPFEYPFAQKFDEFSFIHSWSENINSQPPYSVNSPWSKSTNDSSLESPELFTSLKQNFKQNEMNLGENTVNEYENEFTSLEALEHFKGVQHESTQIKINSDNHFANNSGNDADDSDDSDNSDGQASLELGKKHSDTTLNDEDLFTIDKRQCTRKYKDSRPKTTRRKIHKIRSNHSEKVITELTEWLIKHRKFPYPDKSEKKMMMESTGLSKSQLDNW